MPSINPDSKSLITPWKFCAMLGNTVIKPYAASLNPIAPIDAASSTAAAISPPASPPIALIPDTKLATPVVSPA